MLSIDLKYHDEKDQVSWRGKHVANVEEFKSFLSTDGVRNRLYDEEEHQDYEAELRALATTDMETDTIERLLSSEPEKISWEVGEALAESLLEEERGVTIPWNGERDKKTPKASLPGADIVGFINDGDDVYLMIGEVKTSNDSSTPPQVMYGKSGMNHQLENLATNISIHNCLLQWLRPRCKEPTLEKLYQAAVVTYLRSHGKAIKLIGMLMRDTAPAESDLRSRGRKLANKVTPPTDVELDAWYFPVPISAWVQCAKGGIT
ncbi:MAG: hypothetical protein IH613_10015 [Desulfuromonadales bacterium]|nr:hypothetical protein [Desulfuromonadales bacterium]